ncbi:MAG: sirohydrochlorin chelatase [Moorea sp. SIO2B7]|nr:sirohydrochlorin chelatase [Moorena sp. SIO2B7]
MTSLSAYLLVSHGSRDSRPQIAVERLAYLVCQQLQMRVTFPQLVSTYRLHSEELNIEKTCTSTTLISKPPSPLVGTASLELAPLPLHESIQQFAHKAQTIGVKRIQILPLFLLPGVHVKQDIPREVTIAQQFLGEELVLELRPHLGSYTGMKTLLENQFDQISAQGRILLSHGSRRLNGNKSCEALALQLGAIPAYWSVSPSLATQIAVLAAGGKKTIAIQQYFLFAGGITEAIATKVQHLQQVFPTVRLLLSQPLGVTAELANLIVEGIKGEVEEDESTKDMTMFGRM